MNQVINTNSFPELGNRAHTSFSTCETSSLSGLSNLFGKDWVQKNKNSGRWSINPLHPNISMHILRTVICSFPKMLTWRTCQTIKSFSLALVGDPFLYSHNLNVWLVACIQNFDHSYWLETLQLVPNDKQRWNIMYIIDKQSNNFSWNSE